MTELMEGVDVIFTNEEEAEMMFGIRRVTPTSTPGC